MLKRSPRLVIGFVLILAACTGGAPVATENARLASITTPEEFLGFEIGADYELATYDQLSEYWEVLASESDRMVLRSIGTTEEGREQLEAIITSPANQSQLDHYREISERLSRGHGVDEAEARQLAAEGKAVVWIDGGLHATEVLGAQQLMQLVYDMVSRDDAETRRILDDVILLATHANPDGHALVAGWYMRNEDPLERSTGGIPVLYEKYAGHDNNRDFYMDNLAETQNMARVLFNEWYPQIVYNHHQTGPAGAVMFAPPFRDPMNYFLDPMLKTGLDQVGSAMHQRMIVEGKGGTVMRGGASYSTWWNGGLRTTPYFHNQIGLLTETIGNPTPVEVPFVPGRQISTADEPLPVTPGPWHFKQSIDYSQTANRAVLDYASRNREHLLFNIWRMGMNSIEDGSADHWTVLPFEVDAARESTPRGTVEDFERLFHDPAKRDARGYVVPADQADFQTARKFINTLLMNGVEVLRANADFEVAGTSYPSGSFVVRTDQAFRPHVLDMFEPQQHPNDFAYPGAPPTPPYDNAGWTLAFQMGVDFDRVVDDFDGPFDSVDAFSLDPDPASIEGPAEAAGFVVDHRINDAFVLVNRALREGGAVYWMREPLTVEGRDFPTGAFYFDGGDQRDLLATAAQETGVPVFAVAAAPSGPALQLRPARIGLWDRYGGSSPSGWTRFVLEEFDFDYQLVFPPELDAGGLGENYDVLIFPDGAIPSASAGGGGRGGFGGFGGGRGGGRGQMDIPEEYQDRLGSVTAETTVPQILDFADQGGVVITVGSSTNLAYHAGLPVSDQLVDESGQPLRRQDLYIPGSVLEIGLGGDSPMTDGMPERLRVFHDQSPVFHVAAGARGVTVLGSYDTDHPLVSGWAWGQDKLEGGAALLEADRGQGKIFLFGPEVTFRGQPHGTFPLIFNAIYYGTGEETTLR